MKDMKVKMLVSQYQDALQLQRHTSCPVGTQAEHAPLPIGTQLPIPLALVDMAFARMELSPVSNSSFKVISHRETPRLI